jgi:signal recognition particle receptor subunit beta
MVQFNNTSKEMTLKLVYVGCALGGKTTSLERIHERALQTQRSRLFSLNTANDRTLFFDLLPLDLGTVNGMSVRLQLYTVPGQVQYAATRRAVLAGADAVMVVVDSGPGRAQDNRDALRDLAEHLRSHGMDIRGIPLVLQYNKRDLPDALPLHMLQTMLNQRDWPYFESTATTGEGVVDAFLQLVEIACEELTVRHRLPSTFAARTQSALERLLPPLTWGAPPARKDQAAPFPQLDSPSLDLEPPSLEMGLAAAPELPETSPARSARFLTRTSVDSNGPMDPEHLLHGALEAQQAMVELSTELDAAQERLRLRVAQMAELGRLMRLATGEHNLPELLAATLRSLTRVLDASAMAMLLPEPTGRGLREIAIHGADKDPLNHTLCAGAPSVAAGLFHQSKGSMGPAEGSPNSLDRHLTRGGYTSHMALLLTAQGLQLGMLTAYRSEPTPPFDAGDRAMFSAAASLVALMLETTRLRNLVQSLQAPRDVAVGQVA